MTSYKININFKPLKAYSNIELELQESLKNNQYYFVGDEFDINDGEFDRILQKEYEDNKAFFNELAHKYGDI